MSPALESAIRDAKKIILKNSAAIDTQITMLYNQVCATNHNSEENRGNRIMENSAAVLARKWKRAFSGLQAMTIGLALSLLSLVMFLTWLHGTEKLWRELSWLMCIIICVITLAALDGRVFRGYYERRTGYAEPKQGWGALKNRHVLLGGAVLLAGALLFRFMFPAAMENLLAFSKERLGILNPQAVGMTLSAAVVLFVWGALQKDWTLLCASGVPFASAVPLAFVRLQPGASSSAGILAIGVSLLALGILWHIDYLRLGKNVQTAAKEETPAEASHE